tara:strand:+ start:299 stop:766 length:468 start_codon:yes stop_codon:yes gene_type:complete
MTDMTKYGNYEIQVVLWEKKFIGTIYNNFTVGENQWDTITLWADDNTDDHKGLEFITIAQNITPLQLNKFTNKKTSQEIISIIDCYIRKGNDIQRTWDIKEKQKVVSVMCHKCEKVYTDRQSNNDCISMWPYEYPKKGYFWRENEECYKCDKNSL